MAQQTVFVNEFTNGILGPDALREPVRQPSVRLLKS